MESGDRELRQLAHEALTVTSEPGDPSAASAAALWRPQVLAADGLIVPRDQQAAFESPVALVTEDNITELAAKRWGTAHTPRLAELMGGPGAPHPRLRQETSSG